MSNLASALKNPSMSEEARAILENFPDAIVRVEASGNELEKALIAAVKRCAEGLP